MLDVVSASFQVRLLQQRMQITEQQRVFIKSIFILIRKFTKDSCADKTSTTDYNKND